MQAHPDVARLEAARPSRLADVIGVVCNPPNLLVVMMFAVAVVSSPSWQAGLAWGAIGSAFTAVMPMMLIHARVRSGSTSDSQLLRREERLAPLFGGVLSVGTGLLCVLTLGGPRELVAFVAAMLAGLSVMLVLSLLYKASFHVGVAAGLSMIGVLCVGWWLLAVMGPVVVMIGWARVRAGRHTLGQVLTGCVVGAVVGGGVFALLR